MSTVTLDINGRKVKVDSSFLSLSKEDQDRTVDEIWGSISGQGGNATSANGVQDGPWTGGKGTGSNSPLAQFRQQYPQYGDMNDRQLADALYAKFYSDMPRSEFDQKIGPLSARMPVFTIQAPDGRKIKIQAADEATALRGAQEWAAANPASTSPNMGNITKLQGKVSELPSRQPAPVPPPDLLSSTLTTVNGISASVPFLQNTTDAIGGTIAQLTGGDYQQYIDRQRAIRENLARQAPLARGAGEFAGYVAAPLAAGSTRLGAEALGLTGKFGQRLLNSTLSSTGIATADALSRGEEGTEALTSGAMGGAIGGAMPILGATVRAAGRGLRDNFIRPVMTAANRENEVTRRIGGAIAQDTAQGARMAPEMAQTAERAGAEVLNADRFGSAIRTLARTSANVSPEADNIFKATTEQRFATQGNRAVNFVRQLMNGATDDLALQDALKTAARASNKTAYDAAYAAPNARNIVSPKIGSLMAADEFKSAMAKAEKAAATDAAISGRKAVRNPFTFDADGNVTGYREFPDGSTAQPSLEYWDVVQRELRKGAEAAMRSGGPEAARPYNQLRNQLLSVLDTAVPEFKQARVGAAGFFGAEDAIEAGRKAVTSTKQVNEIGRAVAAMSPAEKDAFAVGFSSEIIDAISATRDRVNVINSIFGSESARQRIRIALGPQKARELEAFVKMEQVLDMLRTATQGNSTTAKLLIQAGLMGGGAGAAGFFGSGGDLSMGFSAATLAVLGRRGAQLLGKSVDDQVMKRVAEVLSSTDPAQLERAIRNASLSPAHIDAIDGIMRGLALSARGSAIGAMATGSAE